MNSWTVEFDSPQTEHLERADPGHVGTRDQQHGWQQGRRRPEHLVRLLPGSPEAVAGTDKPPGERRRVGQSACHTPRRSRSQIMTVAEATAGTSNASFTVRPVRRIDHTGHRRLRHINGTATAGADYTATSGTVTFAAGVTS